jgi:hypothetical protein
MRRLTVLLLSLAATLIVLALPAGASATRTETSGTGYIHGFVRDATTSAALNNVNVFLLRLDTSNPSDPQWVSAGQENTGYIYVSASYAFEQLPAGTYKLEFVDSTGVYAPQWWDDVLSEASATRIDLPAAGNVSADVHLVKAGHIVGKVTNTAGKPLAGIWVQAASSSPADDLPSTEGATKADGSYDISGLNSGQWIVEFTDPKDVYQYQFWPNKLVFEAGTPIAVTAGANATLNATMQLPAAISKLLPASGARGAKVTITGKRFGATRSGGKVFFGKKAATTYLKWSATKIVCKVPRGAAKGKLSVNVQTTSSFSKGKTFHVL